MNKSKLIGKYCKPAGTSESKISVVAESLPPEEKLLHDNPKVILTKIKVSETLQEVIDEVKQFSLDVYKNKRYTDHEAESFCLFMNLEKGDISLLSHNKEYQDKMLNNKYYKQHIKYGKLICNLSKMRHSL